LGKPVKKRRTREVAVERLGGKNVGAEKKSIVVNNKTEKKEAQGGTIIDHRNGGVIQIITCGQGRRRSEGGEDLLRGKGETGCWAGGPL